MQLVERHCISKGDTRYAVIDRAASASKNLYNAANYEVRQAFIHSGVYLYYEEVYHRMKFHEAYRALPAKVAQQVLKVLDKNWKSYREACKAWREEPSKFLGHPKLPSYKDKQKGRTLLIFTVQAVSRKGLKRGVIQPSGIPIEVQTHHTNVDQVRIVPRGGYYVVEVVYEQEVKQADVDTSLLASLDLGINNLVALTANKIGFIPRLVNGDQSRASTSSITNARQRYKQSSSPIRASRHAWNA